MELQRALQYETRVQLGAACGEATGVNGEHSMDHLKGLDSVEQASHIRHVDPTTSRAGSRCVT